MTASNHIRNMRRALVALAIFFPVFYAVFAGISIRQDYQNALARAESDVRNISSSLNEHATRTIGEVDSRLQGAIAEIERRGLDPAGPDAIELQDVLKWHVQDLSQAVTMFVVDAGGSVRASSLKYPTPPVDVRDRDYYRYHLSVANPDLFISRPVKSRLSGRWGVVASRRISHPDGSLKLIVLLGMNLDYFNNFYRSLKIGNGGLLALVRNDGWVLMETPLTDNIMDKNLANSMLLEQASQSAAGVYHIERGALTGAARVVGYSASKAYPVIALASMSREVVLQAWLRQAGQIALIGAISTAMLLTLIALLWRRLNDLVATQASLGRKNEALETSERRYHELVDGIAGIVWEAELPEFRLTFVSANAAAISGYSAEEWLSDPNFWHDKLSSNVDGQRAEAILALNSHTSVLRPVEHHIFAPDGREIWLRSNIVVAAASGDRIHLRGVTVDITQQKQSEKRLFQMAHFDQLTKLPNRQTLVDRLEHGLAIAARGNGWIAVMLMDLDEFKTINDSLGHEAGNKVLVEVGHRIQSCLRPSDTLARIGGDEFVVLVEHTESDILMVEQLAERIAAEVGETIAIDGNEFYVGLSMGISLYPQDGQDCETLMRNADTALYRAKAAGRNCRRFFDESMAQRVARRLDMDTALRRAVERNELRLLYQPQTALGTGRIIGAETLVRWVRPGTGMVSPLEFIPLAEESGTIIPIGGWILGSACHQAAAWRRDKQFDLRIAVNITARQIHHKGFVGQVRKALEESGLPAHLLELEITEGSIIDSIEETVSKLRQVKALGVTVAIDDFGTGYSSLSYLKELPIDRLKIDQSFVRDIPLNPHDCAIVRTIIAMAKNLGLSVIAEGVETQEQVDFLRAEGCDEIQGFLVSEPVTADDLAIRCADAAAIS
ncbi:MAG: bifunctional diguanylate cyclase/phosphodiesterase [Telluria sp.]